MARDGLLPPFFSDVNEKTQVPVKSTIVTGLGSAILAFFMDVSQLSGMVWSSFHESVNLLSIKIRILSNLQKTEQTESLLVLILFRLVLGHSLPSPWLQFQSWYSDMFHQMRCHFHYLSKNQLNHHLFITRKFQKVLSE